MSNYIRKNYNNNNIPSSNINNRLSVRLEEENNNNNNNINANTNINTNNSTNAIRNKINTKSNNLTSSMTNMTNPKYTPLSPPQNLKSINDQNSKDYIDNSNNNNNYETNDKLSNLKYQYDNRLKELYSELKSIINKIESDDILHTMKKDNSTNDYYSQRIKEIVDENLHMEREKTVTRLNEEIVEIKEKNSLAEKQNYEYLDRIKNITMNYEQKLDDNNSSQIEINNEYNKLKVNMQTLSTRYDSEIKKIVDDCNSRLSKQNNEISKYKEENSELNERLNVIHL